MSAEQTPDIADLAVNICSHSGRHTAGDGDHDAEQWGPCSQCTHYARVVAPVLAAAVREAEQRANLLTPWGPFEMGGFEGCTVCRICAQEIEPGEQAWARQWPCYDTLPLDDPMQDWDVISWHDDCPSDRADRITEPVSHEAAASGEEASKA